MAVVRSSYLVGIIPPFVFSCMLRFINLQGNYPNRRLRDNSWCKPRNTSSKSRTIPVRIMKTSSSLMPTISNSYRLLLILHRNVEYYVPITSSVVKHVNIADVNCKRYVNSMASIEKAKRCRKGETNKRSCLCKIIDKINLKRIDLK